MDEKKTENQNHDGHDGMGMGPMMLMMAACCIGLILVVALIPLVGWGPGLALVAVAAVAMIVFHQRTMGPGRDKGRH